MCEMSPGCYSLDLEDDSKGEAYKDSGQGGGGGMQSGQSVFWWYVARQILRVIGSSLRLYDGVCGRCI